MEVPATFENKIHPSVQFSSYVFNFYYVFCSFGYYTFLIPYKFVLSENGYSIETSKFRKVLCYSIHFFVLILGIGNLRKKFSLAKIVDRPTQFFTMAEGICLFSYIVIFIHTVFAKQHVFISILKQSSKCTVDSNKNKKYQRMAIIMHLLAIFSCAAHLFGDTFYGHGSFKNMIRSNAGKFYYGFHLTDSHLPLAESEITMNTTFFTLFFLVVKIFLRLSSHFLELSFYIGAISVGLIVKDFLGILSEHPNLSFQKIIECYDDMKQLIHNINSICGGLVVAVFSAFIFHFARDSIAIFNSTDWWLILDYTQYSLFYLASLIYAAEASHKMKQFTEYLFYYMKNVKMMADSNAFTIIMLEIQSKTSPVGLQGYEFFTVTYNFLGSLLVLGNFSFSVQDRNLLFLNWESGEAEKLLYIKVCSISVTYTIILLQLQ